ncbi:MAG: Bax inhibitor-1/YccA family protein [Verrucomicrobiota bacterium]
MEVSNNYAPGYTAKESTNRVADQAATQTVRKLGAKERRQGERVMSVLGAIRKMLLLWGLALFAAWKGWSGSFSGGTHFEWGVVALGGVGALFLAGVTCFRERWAPVTGPIYALAEGMVFGVGLRLLLRAEGGAFLMCSTLAALVVTMGVYYVAFVCCGGVLRSGGVSVLVGIIVGIAIPCGFWGWGYLQEGVGVVLGYRPFWVGVFLSVCVSINLILDIRAIEDGARYRAPKHMEWYSAFAVLISFVWLLVEGFRIVSVIRSSRRVF